jgi:hypothetical protein
MVLLCGAVVGIVEKELRVNTIYCRETMWTMNATARLRCHRFPSNIISLGGFEPGESDQQAKHTLSQYYSAGNTVLQC